MASAELVELWSSLEKIELGLATAREMYQAAYNNYWAKHLELKPGDRCIWTPLYRYGKQGLNPRPVLFENYTNNILAPDIAPLVIIRHLLLNSTQPSRKTSMVGARELTKETDRVSQSERGRAGPNAVGLGAGEPERPSAGEEAFDLYD